MIRFIIRRVVQGIITLWVIVSLVFVLFFMTKPDPARLLAGKSATLAAGGDHPGGARPQPAALAAVPRASWAGWSTATSGSRTSCTSR